MTTKRRRKARPRSQAPRPSPAPAAAATREAPARPALFGGLFGRAAAGPSPLGRLTSALGRGFVTVGGSWAILAVAFLAVLAEWGVLLAMGTRTTPRYLITAMALPPVGSAVDYQSAQVLGGGAGIAVGFGLIVARAVVVGVLAGLIIEALEGRAPSLDGARRGLRAVPFVVAMNVIGLSALLVGGSILQLLGFGLQFLGNVMLIAALLYFLGFVPAAAIRERRGLLDTVHRARAAASLAGGQQFTLCLLYVVVLLFFLPVLGSTNASGGLITANPSVSAWVYGLVAAYVNVAFLATFGYRWMLAEPVVPDRPAPRRRR